MSRRQASKLRVAPTNGSRWRVPVVLMLVALLVVVALALFPSGLAESWRYERADECPDASASADCVVDLDGVTSGRVTTRSDDGSSLRATVSVSVSDPAALDSGSTEDLTVLMSNSDADRLGITGRGHDVSVRMFDGNVVRITGPDDESATVNEPAPLSRSLVLLALAGVAVAAAAVLAVRLRRRPGEESTTPDSGEPEPASPQREARARPAETSSDDTTTGGSGRRSVKARLRTRTSPTAAGEQEPSDE